MLIRRRLTAEDTKIDAEGTEDVAKLWVLCVNLAS